MTEGERKGSLTETVYVFFNRPDHLAFILLSVVTTPTLAIVAASRFAQNNSDAGVATAVGALAALGVGVISWHSGRRRA